VEVEDEPPNVDVVDGIPEEPDWTLVPELPPTTIFSEAGS